MALWLLCVARSLVITVWHSLMDFKVGVAHPHDEIGSWSASPSFGTLIKCVGSLVEWAGPAGNKKISRICMLDIACEHLVRTRRTSSTSTRVREVGQGVTKKGAEFWIWRQTDFRANCTVVSLIQLHESQQNLKFNLVLKELLYLGHFTLIVWNSSYILQLNNTMRKIIIIMEN